MTPCVLTWVLTPMPLWPGVRPRRGHPLGSNFPGTGPCVKPGALGPPPPVLSILLVPTSIFQGRCPGTSEACEGHESPVTHARC